MAAATIPIPIIARTARLPAMRPRAAAYWVSTVVVAAAFVSGGLAYLLGAEVPLRGMAELGYPGYFVALLGVLLGVWKVLGGLALVAPRCPRLKEWAYAGIAFDLTGAAVSHAATAHGTTQVLTPLVCLLIAAASWAFRPAGRRLGAPPLGDDARGRDDGRQNARRPTPET